MGRSADGAAPSESVPREDRALREVAGSGASARAHPSTRREDHDRVRVVHRDHGVAALQHLPPRHASTALRSRGRGRRYLHRMSTLRLQRFVRTSMWLLPIGCLAAGALLAVGTLAVDRATGYRLVPQSPTGTPSDAQTILSSFATAMVSLTTLVLTVTLVAVQLAMGQFSPRIVGALLTDRWSQLAIGLFGGSFLVTVLTLREIRGSDKGSVPGLSMLLSYVLMFASIVVLVLFVHHAGQGLRAAGLIDLVGDRSREFIVRAHGERPVATGGPEGIAAAQPGNVVRLDRRALVAAARGADCVLELIPVVGDFVVGGSPLFRVHRNPRSTVSGDGDPAGRLRATDVTRHV